MFVQATTPRPVLDGARFPEYVYIHTLAKPGVSEGAVFFSSTSNAEYGKKDGKRLEPVSVFPIEGDEGFQAMEYILPFFELFLPEDKKRNLRMVPFCSAGFGVVVKSAFRMDSRTFAERTVSFHIQCPVTGGGILRLSDCPFDVTNPTFDPWAVSPVKTKASVDDTLLVYKRTFGSLPSSASSSLRAARIAQAEASAMANTRGLPEKEKGPQALPEPTEVLALPEVIVDRPELEDRSVIQEPVIIDVEATEEPSV